MATSCAPPVETRLSVLKLPCATGRHRLFGRQFSFAVEAMIERVVFTDAVLVGANFDGAQAATLGRVNPPVVWRFLVAGSQEGLHLQVFQSMLRARDTACCGGVFT